VAIGVILVGLALIGGIVLLIVGGGDNNKTNQTAQDLQNKLLTHTVVNSDKGISVRRPANWTDAKRSGVITIQSPDHCLALQLAAPANANQAGSLHDDAIKLLRESSKKVAVHPAKAQNIGGIPTQADGLDVTDMKGRHASVLLYIGKGKKYAYITKVAFGTAPECQQDLVVGRLILSSVQYTK
jgi:hypothetical protein